MNKELCQESKRTSSSRGAVEAAIDTSKGDRHATWEESVSKSLRRVHRWDTAFQDDKDKAAAGEK